MIEKPYWDEANRLVKDQYTSQIASQNITITRTFQPATRSGWWAPFGAFEGNAPLYGVKTTTVQQSYQSYRSPRH
jgi:hypothetical protein